jgi:hypothetical protein
LRNGLLDQSEPGQWQVDQQVRGREDEERHAPVERLVERMPDRPADGGGEAAEQREIGDRAAPILGIDLHECCERSVIKRQPHRDAKRCPHRKIGSRGFDERQCRKADRVRHEPDRHDAACAIPVHGDAHRRRDDA